MKRLDRYLIKYFVGALLVVTLGIGLTIIAITVIEELRDFIDHKVPLTAILEYYLYFAGWVVKSFLPMFILLAVLFSVSILARRREILAMKACGLSLYRITAPILLLTMLLTAGHFYYSEYIYPPANQRRLEIKTFTIKKQSRRAHERVHNVTRQIARGHFYTVQSFDVPRQEGTEFRIVRYDDNRLERIVMAERLTYLDHRWLALNGVERYFDSSEVKSYREFDTLVVEEILEEPNDFARRIGKPEDMGYEELKRYIDLMKRTGGPYIQESIDLQVKVSYPLSSCIVVLLCVPFAANPRRGGIAVSIAVGAGISLVYFVLFRTMQSAGYSERIPEALAVWGVNGLFLIVGVIAMLSARK